MRLLDVIERKMLTTLTKRVARRGDDECWEWEGGVSDSGYGMINITVPAHRVAYLLANGEIPDGLVVDHTCRNRRCCNPLHLEAVTTQENVLRGTSPAAAHAAKTKCSRGHEYTPENTYWFAARRTRVCRRCKNERTKRSRQKAAVR